MHLAHVDASPFPGLKALGPDWTIEYDELRFAKTEVAAIRKAAKILTAAEDFLDAQFGQPVAEIDYDLRAMICIGAELEQCADWCEAGIELNKIG